MKYSRFEALTIAVAAVAIIGTVVASLSSGTRLLEEVFAQLLLFVVIAGAVHAGLNTGFYLAVGATVLYAFARSPLIMADGGLSGDVAILILIRALGFGAAGVLGGAACDRVRSMLDAVDSTSHLDEEALVYNERFLNRLITSNLGRQRRYGSPFAIVCVRITDSVFADMRGSRRRSAVRRLAAHIRNDVRLVDDVARLRDGSFVLVLPHTPREGAVIATERVCLSVRALLGAREDTVRADIFSAPEDVAAIEALLERLEPDTTLPDPEVEEPLEAQPATAGKASAGVQSIS